MRIIEFLPKKNKIAKKKKKSINFFSFSSFSLQVSLSLSCSASISPFQVCLSLTFTAPVLCLSGLGRLPADSVWFHPGFFHPDYCRLPADSLWFHSLPDHCRLPADNFLLSPLFSCHPGTAGCQPTFFGYAPGIVPFSPQSVASRLC